MAISYRGKVAVLVVAVGLAAFLGAFLGYSGSGTEEATAGSRATVKGSRLANDSSTNDAAKGTKTETPFDLARRFQRGQRPGATEPRGRTDQKTAKNESPTTTSQTSDTIGGQSDTKKVRSTASAFPWSLPEAQQLSLKASMTALTKSLQSSERARSEYSEGASNEGTVVRVQIRAPSDAERREFWTKVQDESAKMQPETSVRFLAEAARQLEKYLGLPKAYRVLFVVSSTELSENKEIEGVAAFVFDTDTPASYSIGPGGSISSPGQLLTFMQPWFEPGTYEPSYRYGHLVSVK